jgi:hypothetical protein
VGKWESEQKQDSIESGLPIRFFLRYTLLRKKEAAYG